MPLVIVYLFCYLKFTRKLFGKFQANLFDDKLHHELLHNRLCKHLLRVHFKGSNFAVRGELDIAQLKSVCIQDYSNSFSIFLKSLKAIHSLRIHLKNVISKGG